MNDLISRDAAIEAAFKGADDWDGGFNPKYLMAIPAVDAAPVVRGRWLERHMVHDAHLIDEWQSALCSRCGKYHTTPYLYYFENYNYCPNCGAKMKGESS